MTPIVTCEHGGREVPASLAGRFAGHEGLLDSHRGWDPGARAVAEALARRLRCPLFVATVTRLVVDLNRSLGKPGLFSEITRDLPEEERQRLLEEHWFPYRTAVETAVAERIATARPAAGTRTDARAPAGNAAGAATGIAAIGGEAPLLHLSIHSFTPVWEGQPRTADVGLLFDPDRDRESAFCAALRDELHRRRPDLRTRFNEPYRGVDDGLTTHLRSRFGGDRYLGIEIEISQRFPLGDPTEWETLREALIAAVAGVAAPRPTLQR